MILDLVNDRATGKKGGKLVVREETVASNKDHLYFSANCRDLNFWKLFGRAGNPFLTFSKPRITKT